MYIDEMKSLIKYALELNISSICTFKGYKGGNILKFEVEHIEDVRLIKNYCKLLEVNTNIKEDNIFTIFCEFGKDLYDTSDLSDFEFYNLK